MKVNKSSKECAEYNTNNAAAIDVGVLESHEPSDEILRREEKTRLEDEASAKVLSNCVAILGKFGQHSELTQSSGSASAEFDGVSVSVAPYFCSHGSLWPSSFECWRVTIFASVSYDNKTSKWVRIDGDSRAPTISAKQVEKVLSKIAEVKEWLTDKLGEKSLKDQAEQRKAGFLADPSKALIIKHFSLSSWYQEACSRNGYKAQGHRWGVKDGVLNIDYSSRPIAQWQAMAEMLEKHDHEYAELVASFPKS